MPTATKLPAGSSKANQPDESYVAAPGFWFLPLPK
jgi:hypothetical protein